MVSGTNFNSNGELVVTTENLKKFIPLTIDVNDFISGKDNDLRSSDGKSILLDKLEEINEYHNFICIYNHLKKPNSNKNSCPS